MVRKLIESAIANAEHKAARQNTPIDIDDLVVKRIFVDQGPTLRRFRALLEELRAQCGDAVVKQFEGSTRIRLRSTDGQHSKLGRTEPFLDVSLPVDGHAGLDAALRAWREPEMMTGSDR